MCVLCTYVYVYTHMYGSIEQTFVSIAHLDMKSLYIFAPKNIFAPSLTLFLHLHLYLIPISFILNFSSNI